MDATQEPFNEQAIKEEDSDEESLTDEALDELTLDDPALDGIDLNNPAFANEQAFNEEISRIDRDFRRRLPPRFSWFWHFFPLILILIACLSLMFVVEYYRGATPVQQPTRVSQQQGEALDQHASRKDDRRLPSAKGEVEVNRPTATRAQVVTAVVAQGDQVPRDVVVQRGGVAYSDNVIVGNITSEVEKGRIARSWGERGMVVQ
ncbi:MAG: hypothetical protein Q9169_000787 [Polycauliona sp. 2 TL-2023]